MARKTSGKTPSAKTAGPIFDPTYVLRKSSALLRELLLPFIIFGAGVVALIIAEASDAIVGGYYVIVVVGGTLLCLGGTIAMALLVAKHLRSDWEEDKIAAHTDSILKTRAGLVFYWAIGIGSALGLILAIILNDVDALSTFTGIIIIFACIHYYTHHHLPRKKSKEAHA